MSPALTTGLNFAATTGPGVNPGLPIIPSHWNNPLPDTLKELDGRKIILQAKHNRVLEMHPNGVRGVNAFTDYCVLSLIILNITSLNTGKDESTYSHLAGWMKSPGDRKHWESQEIENGTSKHILRGNATGMFLCMDDRSVVYQSENLSYSHCVFNHEVGTEGEDNIFTDRYFRQVNSTKWYLGVNRDGSVRCGNVTRKNQGAANFLKLPFGQTNIGKNVSPPFTQIKKECCTGDTCKHNRRRKKDRKNKKDGKEISKDLENREDGEGHKRNRRCHKKWCRKHRRRFFSLKLKELRRYYNRCVRKIRHCSSRKQKNVNR